MSDIVVEQPAVVEADLNYLVANGVKPATYAYDPPAGVPPRSGVYQTRRVKIANARVTPPPGGLSLDRNGFELRQHASALSDFADPTVIERTYYPESEALLKGRMAIVNLWRPIGWPVETSPLALCDARSIALNDLVPSDLIYPDRVGETYSFVFDPRHRWYYFPLMTPDEVLLLKIYDSAGDGVARLTAHTAFDDPSSPPDARPRRSIELRALLFF
ncbi:CmcJ/NvfI family oxidoreductase [Paraburkholderia sp. BR13439]|uniref:CmcJ/NvfI family oxidoreductase n=1 Tax=Paraburkholderia sp. BR13439 TaxID=3236996 RepID=UPI0034CE7E79